MEKFRFCLVAFRSRYGYRSFCAAAAQTHGPSRGWLPTIGPTFWSTLPFSSGPPQGGLLSSLNAGAANGLLGRLAAPVEHLESAHPGGIWAILSRSAAEPMGGSLPSLPRSPGWESLTTRLHLDSAEPLPAAPGWLPSNVGANNSNARGWTRSTDGEDHGGDDGVPPTLSDVTPDNDWIPGADYAGEGHHEFPRAHYKRMPPETQKVFDQARTGQLYLSIDNRRHEYDRLHREYNKATGELLKRFMGTHNISGPEQMTPDHARAALKAIAESEDPRIRLYGEFIKRLRLFYRLRSGGRGSE
jgi:hypothetical protein